MTLANKFRTGLGNFAGSDSLARSSLAVNEDHTKRKEITYVSIKSVEEKSDRKRVAIGEVGHWGTFPLDLGMFNEFLKEHRRVEELEATLSRQTKEMKAVLIRLKEQEAALQKVSAQIELNEATQQTVAEK